MEYDAGFEGVCHDEVFQDRHLCKLVPCLGLNVGLRVRISFLEGCGLGSCTCGVCLLIVHWLLACHFTSRIWAVCEGKRVLLIVYSNKCESP